MKVKQGGRWMVVDRVWECPEGLTRHPWKFSTIRHRYRHLRPRHHCPQLAHNVTTEVVRLGFNETHQGGGSDDVATSGLGPTGANQN